jgi:hypothetical protein
MLQCPCHGVRLSTDHDYPANERPAYRQPYPNSAFYIDFVCSVRSLRLRCTPASPDLSHRTGYCRAKTDMVGVLWKTIKLRYCEWLWAALRNLISTIVQTW